MDEQLYAGIRGRDVSKQVFAALTISNSVPAATTTRHYRNSILNGDDRGTELKRI